MVKEEISYKDNLIVVYTDGSVMSFLYNEDGDIETYCDNSIEQAKTHIDRIEKRRGGLYDADGIIYSSPIA